MSERDDGGPAFPYVSTNVAGQPLNIRQSITSGGMTLRDYFAAKAMHAILCGYFDASTAVEADLQSIAPVSYSMADSMLKARKA